MSPKLKKEMKKILLALLIFFVLVIAEKSGIAAPLMENRLINTILYLIPYLIVGYPVLRKAFLVSGRDVKIYKPGRLRVWGFQLLDRLLCRLEI